MTGASSFSRLAFFIALTIIGTVLVYVGRNMHKPDEEEWKWDFWTREFVNGPPGYYRAIVTLLGSVLIFTGVVGTIIAIVTG